jgi:large subunit ribosomal protein L25
MNLKVQSRTTKGNSPARALRRNEKVPAVLYGPRTESRMLSIDLQQLETLAKKGGLGRYVFNLHIDDKKKAIPVMIKEVQTHPVSGDYLHVDFYEVIMDRKIRVNVPVQTTGKAIGIEMGGMLQLIRRELEVFCLPNDIPEAITIDISELNIGDSVHVEDIKVEGDKEIIHDVNFTVLTISVTKQEVEEVEEEEEGEGEGEVEGEGAGEAQTAEESSAE